MAGEVEMRRLILQMQMSIDGFAGGPNGELDWIFPGFGSDATGWIVDRLWQAGAHLMGGATYRDMAAHWPTSSEPAAAPMNQIPKLVLSRSLHDAPWGETRIVAGDAATEVARQKQECGRDLLAHGGVRFARSLIQSGLIDEYRLIVHPVVLGRGLQPFSQIASPARLALVEAVTFKTGVIAKTLRPA
jgi:dihydrofolate reductase